MDPPTPDVRAAYTLLQRTPPQRKLIINLLLISRLTACGRSGRSGRGAQLSRRFDGGDEFPPKKRAKIKRKNL